MPVPTPPSLTIPAPTSVMTIRDTDLKGDCPHLNLNFKLLYSMIFKNTRDITSNKFTPVGPVSPIGNIDGANKIFVLPDAPKSLLMLFHGTAGAGAALSQFGVAYTINGNQIKFVTAPPATDWLVVYYLK